MKLYFDFDDVLFNTGAFIQEKKRIFLTYGVSEEVYLETYGRAKVGEVPLRAYDFALHLTLLQDSISIDAIEGIRTMMKELSERAHEFVFPDVLPIFNQWRDLGHELYLVSFGDIRFQQQKIIHSGLVPYFTKIMIGRHKKSELMKDVYVYTENESAWFIDDQIHFLDEVKNQYPGIQTLHMIRPEGRMRCLDLPESMHQIVTDMNEVFQKQAQSEGKH